MNNTFCPNCNSNFNFEFKHSCTYTNKLNSISDKFNSLHTTNSEIKSNISLTKENITSLKNQFINSYNLIISDLTYIIEQVDSHSKSKQDEIEESPASLISSKIINLNKSETYLLDQNACMLLCEWLGKEAQFELIFRATTDGFDCKDFHAKCDKMGPTVVVLRNNFDKIIGGYSQCEWDGTVRYDYTYVKDDSQSSFLFSITQSQKYPCKTHEYSISNSANHGPKYGGGHDLEIVSNCNANQNQYSGIGHTFEFTGSKTDFYGQEKYLVNEYEVYRVL